jgi:DNA-binding response OmpR family regulator
MMDEKYEILLSKSSILLAEDEERLRESFQRVLLLYVSEVYSAKDGEEAYTLYKKHRPDIVITDIKMPKINGLELVKMIRLKDAETPIVVTSAYTDQDFLMELIKLSLVEYLVKPVKERDLSRVLAACAQRLYQDHRTLTSITDTLQYDLENKLFIHGDERILLTHKEIEIVELLLSHQGNLVTKQQIEETIYIYEEAPPSALKNLVFKLRKKLPEEIIETVGKLGYVIKA